MAAALAEAGAAETVRDADELASAVSALLSDRRLRGARAAAGAGAAAAGGAVLDTVLAALAPWLDRLAPELTAVTASVPTEGLAGTRHSLRA
jgi:hypothetical protein